MLKNISGKIGFTQTEIRVIIFLVVVFLIGFGAKSFFLQKNIIKEVTYDYSVQDSIFESAGSSDTLSNTDEIDSKNVDYKQEVLDFKKVDFEQSKKAEPPEKSININSASLKDLLKLPGIGEKTAENILDYRQKIGKFKKLEEILEVKGIGNSKFNKIKKYLIL